MEFSHLGGGWFEIIEHIWLHNCENKNVVETADNLLIRLLIDQSNLAGVNFRDLAAKADLSVNRKSSSREEACVTTEGQHLTSEPTQVCKPTSADTATASPDSNESSQGGNSSDYYSNGDDTMSDSEDGDRDGQVDFDRMLDSMKQKMVNSIMAEFLAMFGDGKSRTTPCNPTECPITSTSSTFLVDWNGSGSSNPKNAGRLPHRRGSDASNSGDDDQPKRPTVETPPARSFETRLRFACPYFKRNAEKHQRWRSCAGPGWNSVHRVK